MRGKTSKVVLCHSSCLVGTLKLMGVVQENYLGKQGSDSNWSEE